MAMAKKLGFDYQSRKSSRGYATGAIGNWYINASWKHVLFVAFEKNIAAPES
jgi:hypothetical protein